MNDRTNCYEFIGIWGSGKTTLINDVSKKLISDGFVVKNFLDFFIIVTITSKLFIVEIYNM